MAIKPSSDTTAPMRGNIEMTPEHMRKQVDMGQNKGFYDEGKGASKGGGRSDRGGGSYKATRKYGTELYRKGK